MRRRRKRGNRGAKANFALMRRVTSPNYCKMKLFLFDTIVNNATNTAQISATVSPRSFTFAYTPQNLNADVHVSMLNFAKIKDLWDEYRVYYIKLIYRPLYQKDLFVSDGSPNFMPTLAVAYDKDNQGALNNTDINSLKGVRHFDLTKAWTFGTGIPRYNSTSTTGASAQTEGWENLQNEGASPARVGIIGLESNGLINPNPGATIDLGSLQIEVSCEFRSRQDSNTTAYYGVTSVNNEVISDLAISGNTHEEHKSAVEELVPKDGEHPF